VFVLCPAKEFGIPGPQRSQETHSHLMDSSVTQTPEWSP
jgi:hypothetical protein